MRVRRIDSLVLFSSVTLAGVQTRFDAVEVTPEGWHIYDAFYARADIVQEYSDGRGGVIREYRPPAEVFDAASMASYELRPLTDLHPPRNLDSSTARVLARGAVSAGRQADDGIHVAGRLAVWDADLIRKFEAARKDGTTMQLSAGYELDLDTTPGQLADGRRYDAIQRNIRINHVAAVPLGRAGTARVLDAATISDAWDLERARKISDVAQHRGRVTFDMGRWCRHDAADILEQHQEQDQDRNMKKLTIKIDGKDVTLEHADDATPEHIATLVGKAHADAAKAREDALRSELDKLRKDADMTDEQKRKKGAAGYGETPEEQKQDAAAAKADAEHKAELDKVRADANARAETVAEAKTVLGLRFDAAKLDDAQIKLAVIKHVLGDAEAKDVADDPGAIGYLYRKALARHVDGPSHTDSLVDEIRKAKADRRKQGDDAKPGPITTARRDAQDQAALPRHQRKTA